MKSLLFRIQPSNFFCARISKQFDSWIWKIRDFRVLFTREGSQQIRILDRKEARIRVLPFHAALAQDTRLTNLKEFLKSQSADSMFLVCTDRASRGIDFEKVDHVVLFDFPREPSEYVRRVGRTAHGAGGAGKAYIFAVGKQVSLAGRIIEGNQKGHPLHDVPGAYALDRY